MQSLKNNKHASKQDSLTFGIVVTSKFKMR